MNEVPPVTELLARAVAALAQRHAPEDADLQALQAEFTALMDGAPHG